MCFEFEKCRGYSINLLILSNLQTVKDVVKSGKASVNKIVAIWLRGFCEKNLPSQLR